MKNNSTKIFQSPDDAQKRFKGLIAGSKGCGYAEVFPDEKKINFFKKIKKISENNKKSKIKNKK